MPRAGTWALCVLVFGCTGDDGDTDGTSGTSGGSTTDHATSSSAGSSSGATSGSSSGDSSTEGSTGAATDPGPTGEPVPCGEATCAAGQVCLQLGLRCDYGQDPPMFYTPDPSCQDLPDDCEGLSGQELDNCIGFALCQDTVCGGLAGFVETTYECNDHDCDCF